MLRTSAFINVTTPKEKAKYVDACWDILQASYANIGGFQSAASKEELIAETSLWKMVRKNDAIVACAIYKPKFGRKCIAYGTNGSAEGKKAVVEVLRADLGRSWVECSGAVERSLLKLGGEKYRVPARYAEKLTGKKCKVSKDGWHYTRDLNGHIHEKLIIGTPTGIEIERTLEPEVLEARVIGVVRKLDQLRDP